MSNRLIAHLAHLEVFTPKPDESLRFYTEVLGLEETQRDGQSAYLRAWGEWSHHSLKLTEGPQPGLGHIGWRAASPEDLTIAVARLEEQDAGVGWLKSSLGHGPAFRYRSPGDQLHEIFWEDERYVPPPGMESPYPNRPQRYAPRGVAPRQIDHVTVMASDPIGAAEWFRDTLGYRFTEYIVLDEDPNVALFAMVTNNEKSHDLGLILDQSPISGRIHHFAWWVDSRDELLRAADTLVNADVPIEFGPGRHGMGEQDYLYVREPGGLRVEVVTGGYRLYAPDLETKRWVPSLGPTVFYKNLELPESLLEAFPSAQPAAEHETAKQWMPASTP
jgi:catechol 2,3-dioxygenase